MRRYLVFILASIILASCGSSPEETPDWCWTYDFRASDNSFSIPSGQWVDEIGLQTIDGDLSFSYTYESFVTPTLIYVTVQRDTAVNDIYISTAGIIYGVSSAFSVTIPAGNTDIATASFTPATIGDAGNSINVTIDATFASEEELNVISIEVMGNGATPFAHNPCAEPTPTPSITPFPTGQPTFTAVPTNTPSPSPSPTDTVTPTDTPAPTVEPACEIVWDFTVSDYGFTQFATGTGDGGLWLTGVGFRSTGAQLGFVKQSAGLTGITRIDVSYYHGDDTIGSYSSTIYAGDLYYDAGYSPRWRGEAGEHWRERDPYVSTDEIWQIMDYTLPSVTPHDVNEVSLQFSAQESEVMTFTGMRFTCSDIPTPTPTNTPDPSMTPTATLTPAILITSTPYNYQPTIDFTQTTATPPATPLPTGTDFPRSTAYATQSIGAGTPTLSVEEIRENEAEWELLEEEKRGNNASENILQDILDALTGGGDGGGGGISGTPGPGEGGGAGVAGLGDWANAVSDSLYGIQGLFGNVGGYFSQTVSGANALVTSFYTAPPQSIPGLPLCFTAPLDYDICAIYYVMDWTLFAPNTLGSYIVPLLLAIMNVLIIFRVLGYVLKLINRTEDVTR